MYIVERVDHMTMYTQAKEIYAVIDKFIRQIIE